MPFDFGIPQRNVFDMSPAQVDLWGRLLAWLDDGGDDGQYSFNYSKWASKCGTAACIGGWLDLNTGGERSDHFSNPKLPEIIGVPYETAEQLFFDGNRFLENPTPGQAASCVRHMLETGEVNWRRAMGDVQTCREFLGLGDRHDHGDA
jgi:hypothetical protein